MLVCACNGHHMPYDLLTQLILQMLNILFCPEIWVGLVPKFEVKG